jgi:hypothetical protein
MRRRTEVVHAPNRGRSSHAEPRSFIRRTKVVHAPDFRRHAPHSLSRRRFCPKYKTLKTKHKEHKPHGQIRLHRTKRSRFLVTFKDAIGAYSALLGLSPAQVTGQAEDSDYFAYVIAGSTVMHNGSRQWADWKKLTRDGGAQPPSGAPVAPALPAAVTATAAGIEGRFRALVRLVKASPAYNSAIGKALGIEGSEQSGPDLTTIAPDLTATLSGGQVQVGWGWQGYGSKLDMIEILVDRGNGFVPLAYDTTPGYTDTAPFPAAPAKWTYKAIYRKGDSQVGQWSNEVSLTVGG